MRLSRSVKRRYVDAMEEEARAAGLRFYVSDAHFKERSDGCCCCGLDERVWNVQRGQFAEALLIAKRRDDHRVRWADISAEVDRYFQVPWETGIANRVNATTVANFHSVSVAEYVRYIWNNPNNGKSPYRYFQGALRPVGLDASGNMEYEYVGDTP